MADELEQMADAAAEAAVASMGAVTDAVSANSSELGVGDPGQFLYGFAMGAVFGNAGALEGRGPEEQARFMQLIFERMPEIRRRVYDRLGDG